MILSLLIAITAQGADLPGEVIYTARQEASAGASAEVPSAKDEDQKNSNIMLPQKSVSKRKTNSVGVITSSANIPSEYLGNHSRQSTASELIMPPKGSVEVFRSIRVGDGYDLRVEHSVIAFPDEKAPVVAIAKMGSIRGLKFIGESYLEPNTHRIFINFNRVVQGDRVFDLKGVGVSSQGQPGLMGEYHSREAEYFAGDFVSSFVAGYFDGLVPRRTNAFGQLEADSSVDSAVKKGLASGALSTAERFREKLKKVPEFSEIKGPFDLKILILDQAKTTN